MNDVLRGVGLLTAMNAETETLDVVVIPGDPKSKARPRLGKRGSVYSPSRAHEEALAWELKAKRFRRREGNVAVGVIFFRSNYQRMDADNMVKLVLDAGTTANLWRDDVQVTGLMALIELDPENPRTVIAVGDHVSTLDRSPNRGGTACITCGVPVKAHSNGIPRKYCSRECRYGPLRTNKPPVGQGRGRKGQPKTRCRDCGAELSKRFYLRCRECWKTYRLKAIP